jgi:hypothetical protein
LSQCFGSGRKRKYPQNRRGPALACADKIIHRDKHDRENPRRRGEKNPSPPSPSKSLASNHNPTQHAHKSGMLQDERSGVIDTGIARTASEGCAKRGLDPESPRQTVEELRGECCAVLRQLAPGRARFTPRLGTRHYAIRIGDRFSVPPETRALDRVMAEVVHLFEDTVRAFPTQWFQFAPFWPGGAAEQKGNSADAPAGPHTHTHGSTQGVVEYVGVRAWNHARSIPSLRRSDVFL